MIDKFQSFPSWLIELIALIWVIGWLFYFVKKWKTRKQIDCSANPKKFIVNMAGFALAIIILLGTMDWTRNTLLSGLSGIHRGFVGGMFLVVIFSICHLMSNFIWNVIKKRNL